MFEENVKLDWKLIFATIVILVIFCFIVRPTFADEPGDVRGAYFTYSWNTGRFALWEPFLKIAHPKSSPSQDGEPEIWGFRPWNLEPPDENGKTHPVNILESRFIPCDGKPHTVVLIHPHERERKVERSIRCPDHLWR